MPKTPSRTDQKKAADKLFSQRVRARGVCERCGKKPPQVSLQCAHIVSRKYLATRWDFMNALSLCYGCHRWGHTWPLQWEEWITNLIGQRRYDSLRRRARNSESFYMVLGKVDYDKVFTYLRTAK